ncbi:MAG: ABC transporter ATP-binding protein [bacterium]|nr:ABC transporter ATP-binding protein [bacterium]
MNIIETKKLTKYYGKDRGIVDVDLSVEEGEVFGFVGPNGAGKSTTIRTLLSLIYPTSGSATIFGKDVIEHGPEIKQNIGYLPADVHYYDSMKVKSLLNYSASFYDKDCTKRMEQLVKIMDLDVNRKISDLSLGNKKKVGIVQGLLHEPKLIILDEPTSGLDPLMQQNFFNLIEEENQKGATIFFSSHILGEVQKLCDRVAIIKDGKIIKVEKVADLMRNSYTKFRIETKTDLKQEDFNGESINNFVSKKGTTTFLFKGDINVIISKVSELDLISLRIVEPDLEEIFMHYYRDEDADA